VASASTLDRSPVKPSEVTLGKRRATSPPPQNDPDVIMISEDDDDAVSVNKSRNLIPKSGKTAKQSKIKQEPGIPSEILDLTGLHSESSNTDSEGGRNNMQKGTKRATRTVPVKDLPEATHDWIDRKAGIKITLKEKVEHIIAINKIPIGWDVSKKLTGYLLTLYNNAPFLKTDEKSISSWIRHKVSFFSNFYLALYRDML